MRLRRTLLSLSILAIAGQASANQSIDATQWKAINHVSSQDVASNFKAQSFGQFSTSMTQLSDTLSKDAALVTLPLPTGEFVTFKLQTTSVMSPALAQKYPHIRTFEGVDINNPNNRGRFDLTSSGFHGMFKFGNELVMVDPASKQSSDDYVTYFKRDAQPLTEAIAQSAPVEKLNFNPVLAQSNTAKALPQRKRYRLAVSASGEYTAFHGGTKASALEAIVTMVNRINQVYTTDMNIEFQLVDNNDDIIFTDAATDPFINTDDDIDRNQEVVDDAIGSANYDIGHIVNTAGGGLAAFGSACNDSFKAEGVTGSSNPVNDFFWIDFVSHELGHQLRASHTFSANSGSCSSGTVALDSAYEVGSGSTIMGYASLCGAQDIQSAAHDNFHIRSIDEMTDFLSNTVPSCGTVVTQSNAEPVANAGSDFTIPANTPFALTGSASDADGDNLTYSWEQFDLADYSDLDNTAIGPLFRVFAPQTTGERTFPQLSDVLSGNQTFGEKLPDQAREMNFRLVVRDGNGGLDDDAMVVTVANSDGFSVTTPTAQTDWPFARQTVTWDVAGTNSAPISCSQVDILMSTDGGATFNQTLASATANDGQETITVPVASSTSARVKIACTDNVFFAVNSGNFSVNSDGNPDNVPPVIVGQTALTVAEDNSLTLSTSSFSYQDDLDVDSISIVDGENYTVDGLTVTPAENFNGALAVTITATKGSFTSPAFNATVNVTPVNDAPVAVDDNLTLTAGSTARSVSVLNNDSDVDGDSLTVAEVTYSGNGTVTFSASAVSYTPADGFTGTETISYQINDGNGETASANINVQVNAATPPPSSSGGGGGGSLGWFWVLAGVLAFSRRVKS